MSHGRGAVVALAGRRPDPPGADVRRFPLRNAKRVEDRLRQCFARADARTLISSAAAGADLIGLDVARNLGMRRRIVLPYARKHFRETSVTDRPGPWGDLYDSLVDEASNEGDLVVLDLGGEGDAPYLRVNEAILDEATSLADPEGAVKAVVVWEGAARGGGDVTEAFGESAKRRGLEVVEIRTV